MENDIHIPKITFDTKFYISEIIFDVGKFERITSVLKFLNLEIVENKELADVVVVLEQPLHKENLPVVDLKYVIIAIGFLQENLLTYSNVVKYLNNDDVGMNLVGLTLIRNCNLGQLIYDILSTNYTVTFLKVQFLESVQHYILTIYLVFLNHFITFKLFRSNKEMVLCELEKFKLQINDNLFKNIITKIEYDDTRSS